MEFYESNERLPILNDVNDFEEFKIITKGIYDCLDYDKLKSYDK